MSDLVRFVVALLFWSQVAMAQPFGLPEVLSRQDDRRLEEVSGLAPAHDHQPYFWAINDGGNDSNLLLLDENGIYKSELALPFLGNHDWEDLESFKYQSQNYIAIADIGDNFARRKVYYIHLLPAPRIAYGGRIIPLVQSDVRTIAFQYEDGPRDAEAMTIDVEHQRVLLLTKRDAPPRMYELPLIFSPEPFVYRATHLTDVPELGHMSFSGGYLAQTLYSGLPTAMTVNSQTRSETGALSLAVLSYGQVHLFNLWSNPVSIKESLVIQLPAVPQAEALAVGAQGHLLIMSEIVGSPIIQISKL